jgi:dihydroorotate dehydrogenase (fumarate)
VSVDLTTTYLGLRLAHPLVVSACPLSGDLDVLRRLEEAGAAAAVFPSLFEEQIEHEELELLRLVESGAGSSAEADGYLPALAGYNIGPGGYLRRLEEAKHAVAIPLIGSLNGATAGGWTRYATSIQDAGADALELNVHWVSTEPWVGAGEVEKRIEDLVAEVCQSVAIPVAVKLGPYFTALPHFARRLVDAGARGLVLFNRLVHPDMDLDKLALAPRLALSNPLDVRLPLNWIAILRDQVEVSLGASGGVHAPEDAVKLLLAGADAVLVASTLYRMGPQQIGILRGGLASWLAEHGYLSVRQMKGSLSRARCPDPESYERVNYMKTLVHFGRSLP